MASLTSTIQLVAFAVFIWRAKSDCGWGYSSAATVMIVIFARALWCMLFSTRTRRRTVGTQTHTTDAVSDTTTRDAPATFRMEWLTVDQLKAMCRLKNLPLTGLKGELIAKLIRSSQS